MIKSRKHDRYVARKAAQSDKSSRAKVNVLPADHLVDVFAGVQDMEDEDDEQDQPEDEELESSDDE